MRDWLVGTLGLEPGFALVVQFVIALVVILALIGLLTWFLSKLRSLRTETGRRSRQPRLAVMDSTPIDNRRRLILVRRDGVEHLILVGGETDIVVEQTIIRGAPMGVPAQPAGLAQPAVQAVPQSGAPVVPLHQPAAQNVPARGQAAAAPAPAAQASPPQARPETASRPAARQAAPAGGAENGAAPVPGESFPRAVETPQIPEPATRPPAAQAAARQEGRKAAGSADTLSKARAGLAGAAAGILKFGRSKQDAPDQPGPATVPPSFEDARATPAPAAVAANPATPKTEQSTPDPSELDMNLEAAISAAVSEDRPERPAGSPATRPPEKMSPKDQLASQLEALLNTPPASEESADAASQEPPRRSRDAGKPSSGQAEAQRPQQAPEPTRRPKGPPPDAARPNGSPPRSGPSPDAPRSPAPEPRSAPAPRSRSAPPVAADVGAPVAEAEPRARPSPEAPPTREAAPIPTVEPPVRSEAPVRSEPPVRDEPPIRREPTLNSEPPVRQEPRIQPEPSGLTEARPPERREQAPEPVSASPDSEVRPEPPVGDAQPT
ncbi:MAG: hypothetical protein AAGF59_04065 [Pseudomonadota bacterium]